MRQRQPKGFTLPELMVVVAIIALLAATILPLFSRTFALQRKLGCAKQLYSLGEAMAARPAQAELRNMSSSLSLYSWQQDLLNYVGDNRDVFLCPEDQRSLEMGQAQAAQEKLKTVYIEVFNGAAGDFEGHYLWSVPLDESISSEWIWRLNEQQFAEFIDTPGHGQNYAYTGYEPGPDPTTYWFVFEDQGHHGGGDKDYWDMMLKVHYTDSQVEVTPRTGGAGYNFMLTMGETGQEPEDREVLISDMKRAAGDTTVLPGEIGAGSYGINSMVTEMPLMHEKIAILDYQKTIARGSDYDEQQGLDPWFDDPELFPLQEVKGEEIPTFFRHFGQANVLLGDGSVDALSIEEINIFDADARERYWNPPNRTAED